MFFNSFSIIPYPKLFTQGCILIFLKHSTSLITHPFKHFQVSSHHLLNQAQTSSRYTRAVKWSQTLLLSCLRAPQGYNRLRYNFLQIFLSTTMKTFLMHSKPVFFTPFSLEKLHSCSLKSVIALPCLCKFSLWPRAVMHVLSLQQIAF